MMFRRFRTSLPTGNRKDARRDQTGNKEEARTRPLRDTVRRGSGEREVDNVMADYTPWHLTRAAVAPHKRNRIYGGTMGPATLLKGG